MKERANRCQKGQRDEGVHGLKVEGRELMTMKKKKERTKRNRKV